MMDIISPFLADVLLYGPDTRIGVKVPSNRLLTLPDKVGLCDPLLDLLFVCEGGFRHEGAM